jgi:ABC-type nitrate/sulfonate/bicarbonate transport system permease component
LRSAIPDIVVGLRLAVGLAFLLIVGSELIAASEGLGWLIWDARFHFMGDKIIVGMIAIGFVGFCLNRLLVLVERYLLRWKNDEAGEGRVAGLD